MLNMLSISHASPHTINARLSVPIGSPNRNTAKHVATRPRSASLRIVGGSGTVLWDDEKNCIICPLKAAAIGQQSSSKNRQSRFESSINVTDISTSQQQSSTAYTSYSQRWVVLGTVCLLALSNATQWIAFAPLHEAANTFYCSVNESENERIGNGTQSSGLNDGGGCDVETWSSQIFQLVGVLTGLFGMFITDRYGIRVSCHLGSMLNLCGSIIRVISSLPQLDKATRLPTLYLGQTIAASSQPFFLCLSPKVAEYWFDQNQRALANSLSFIANPFGVFLGSIAPVFFVSSPGDDKSNGEQLKAQILYLNISLMGLALFVMFFCFFVTRSKPPTPPSASSQCEHKPHFWEGLCILFRSPVFYIQTFTFGLAFALQWSIFVTADKQLIGLGYGESKATGYLLSLSAFSGSCSSILAGWIVDRTKKFNEFIKGSYIGIALLAIALDVLLHFRHKSEWDTAMLMLLFTLLGFFAIPIFPISLELGVESTFPVAEATSSGILIIAGQLQLFLLTFGMQSLESVDWVYGDAGRNYRLGIDLWTFCAIFAVIFACVFLWPRYYRLEYEQNAVFLNLLPPSFDEIGNGTAKKDNIGTRQSKMRRD